MCIAMERYIFFPLFLFVFLMCYPSFTETQYVRNSTLQWTTANSAPRILPNVQLDQSGIVINNQNGFFKNSFNLTSTIYNFTLSSFLTSAVDPQTNEVYSISQLGNGTSLRYLDIRKYDQIGTFLFNTTFDIEAYFPVNNSIPYCSSIAATVDLNSHLVIVQFFQNLSLLHISRFFPDGTVEIALQLDGLPAFSWQLAVDGDNSLYVSLYGTDDGIAYILKFSDPFNLEWGGLVPSVKASTDIEETWGLVATDDYVYMAGKVHGNIFPFTTGFYSFNGTSDGYIAQFNKLDGSIQNAVLLTTQREDRVYGLTLDTRGNLLACGLTRGYFNASGGTSQFRLFFASYTPSLVRNWINIQEDYLSGDYLEPAVHCSYDIHTGYFYAVQRYSTSSVVLGYYKDALYSPLPSPSNTPTPSSTPSQSVSPSSSVTPSHTPSVTRTPSATPSISNSPTPSVSASPSASCTPSVTPTPSPSMTPTSSVTSTVTPTVSSSQSTSSTPSNVGTQTKSSKKSSFPLAIVAGACAGGVVLIASCAVLAVFIRRRKKPDNNDNLELNPSSSPEKPSDKGASKMEPNTETPPFGSERRSAKSDRPSLNMELLASASYDKQDIPYTELKINEEIGRGKFRSNVPNNLIGAFGVVYKARWRNCDCVVKQLNITDNTSIKEFIKEAANVRKLRNHKNVCSLFGVCTDPNYPISIVMELVEGGSLKDLVYGDNTNLDYPILVRMAKDVASGMSHIHEEGLLHCDLACRNLLYQEIGTKKYLVKVTDLGLSRITVTGQYYADSDAKVPIRWSAPEALGRKKLSRASDVWAFGAVLYEMIEGNIPYSNMQNNQVIEFVLNGGILSKPKRISVPAEYWNIVVNCMAFEPNHRPSFNEIFESLETLEAKITQPSKVTQNMEPVHNSSQTSSALSSTIYANRDQPPTQDSRPVYFS